jgi:uncharacterized sporulation protein YeaH/YhbH (DUF444 family)
MVGGAGGPSMGPAVDMSSMLEKERLEMRAKFEEEAEAERQRIRQELAEKIRKELEQSVRVVSVAMLSFREPVLVADGVGGAVEGDGSTTKGTRG